MINREGWLTELASMVKPLFRWVKLPPHRLTCGWPSISGLSSKRRRVGECHGPRSSKGGVFELFVSPVLDDGLEVAGTVCHELAHVGAGIEAGHGKLFRRVCAVVGLTKGSPAQVMPGDALNETLRKLINKLGPYPHQAIVARVKPARMSQSVTFECVCGFSCTASIKKVIAVGEYPMCGCGEKMIVRVRE